MEVSKEQEGGMTIICRERRILGLSLGRVSVSKEILADASKMP